MRLEDSKKEIEVLKKELLARSDNGAEGLTEVLNLFVKDLKSEIMHLIEALLKKNLASIENRLLPEQLKSKLYQTVADQSLDLKTPPEGTTRPGCWASVVSRKKGKRIVQHEAVPPKEEALLTVPRSAAVLVTLEKEAEENGVTYAEVWDTRCPVGCVATFEGVDVCSDSIDINRDQCVAGSWLPTEALTVWDLVARKRLNIIRIQNRRPNVDGEFLYACRFWRSPEYNRKGKYAIIGGSGTNCVEVINLHNRFITCSYPASGTVLAITSHKERIAFGGTAPVLSIVSFHDPKHEKYGEEEPEYEFTKGERYFSDSSSEISPNQETITKLAKASSISAPAVAVKSSVSQKLK
ncbi:unnamed protein product [Pieris brassicae]|uniref:Uncharacterized protein n=1 Tax=Pieris brassicae TaxID=7116 RepID=A0A9P0XBQ8_PIEBR|nr:unnamed protein product [Pieris brassicae]